MRLVILLISSFFVLMWGSGCASPPPTKNAERILRKSNNQRIYFASYESVWRAAQLALKYPIAVNNIDNGTLETEFIKALDGFEAPEVNKEPSSGVRYKINLLLTKGKIDGRESVRVTINKRIEKKRDFFSEAEPIASDGLEEKVLFYRIERELAIDEAIKKAGAQ